ncbi:hypothetical protein ACM26V_10285 [Salipaludibacillus sp. HK11]|uniref:hypothetical protein n=1 Tax=Salipaludibacillus sp. HK11 TaxID=3394320 RepID=UPI0039FB90CB
MKKTLFSTFIAFFLLMACSDNNTVEQVDNVEDTDDVETLISTNEKLVEQLEKELEEKEKLLDQIQDLGDENMTLKDDILTYKQQAIELEDRHEYELTLRDELDEKARHFFQAMHEADEDKMGDILSSNIVIDSENNILNIMDADGLQRSFHYLQLDSVIFIRQTTFSFDHEEEEFLLRYEFYSDDDGKMDLDGGIEIKFVNEEAWNVSSIRYVNN